MWKNYAQINIRQRIKIRNNFSVLQIVYSIPTREGSNGLKIPKKYLPKLGRFMSARE